MWPKIGFLLLMSTLRMDIGKHSMFVVEGMEFEGNQKCDDICDHEAAALCKCVNEGLKENGPPVNNQKEDSGSAFWTIGLPIIAGGTAAAAAPPVLTAVGFTSAGIASGRSLAASMMSSAAAANGGSVAAGNWKGRKCDDICDHEAAALCKFVNEGWKENGPPVNNQKEDSGSAFWTIGRTAMVGVTSDVAAPGSLAASMMSIAAAANGGGVAAGDWKGRKCDDICDHEAATLCKFVNEGWKENGPPVNNQKEDSGKCDHEAAALCKCVNEGRKENGPPVKNQKEDSGKCDHEAAALFKCVNEGRKENGPPVNNQKEDSRSAFWTIGLPIIAGGTAVAAAPLVLTTVGFTSAGIAAGSWAASMMSTAAAANGGCVAAGSVVAILQSAGAAGIGASSSALIALTAAGVTAGGQAIADN